MTLSACTILTESPRYTEPSIPWKSTLCNILAPCLFVALLSQAFARESLAVWAVGIAYILYDTALLLFTALQIRELHSTPIRTGIQEPQSQTLGVIIAAYNEGSILATTVRRLQSQHRPPDVICIADDGSNDTTADVMISEFGIAVPDIGHWTEIVDDHLSVRWLKLPHRGKSHALNDALAVVETDVVITVDADTLLKENAIASMRNAFAAEAELVAATGILKPICAPSPLGRIFEWFQSYEYVRNFLSRRAWEGLGSLLLISGAFAAFRRDAIIRVGGFDTDCLVEDYELIHRLHRHAYNHGLDWRVRVIAGAMAVTDAPATPLAFLRQRRRWFGGFLQTQHWYRDMVANSHYGSLGTRMLPVKALDTVQPLYGFAAFGILIWLISTGNIATALPIFGIMLAKIVIDLSFHLWSLNIYKRWTGQEGLTTTSAIMVAFAEPFSFQLLRHIGAIWGWIAFLSGRQTWHANSRASFEQASIASLREQP